MLPQDPVLFTGSLRRNLDPFTRHPDAGLWSALEDVGLKARVQQIPGHLYADVAECSSWFDQGDRQLLGLARALLLNTEDRHLMEEGAVRHPISRE